MPEPNIHTAAGIGAAYAAGKLIGIDLDYLIIGLVGALLASARDVPQQMEFSGRYLAILLMTGRAMFMLCSVSFFAAIVTIMVLFVYPQFQPIGIPIAGIVGFFGQILIKSTGEFLSKAWEPAINAISKFFGGKPDASDH